MRLAFAHPFFSFFGGAQLALAWTARGLAARGHQVKVCVEKDVGGAGSALSAAGIEVCIWEEKKPGQTASLDILSQWLIQETRGFDLVVVGNYPSTHWVENFHLLPPILWNCNEPPRPLYEKIMSLHFLGSGADPKFYFPWSLKLKRRKLKASVHKDQDVVKLFGAILSISRQSASWVKTIYGRESRVVPLGIGDMEPQAQCFPEGPFVFFSPAGLEPIKNYKNIFKSFQLLARTTSSRQAKLWVTGDGFWRKDAENLVKQLGIKAGVEFLGKVSRTELIELYRRCHVVLYLPLDEPFGLVCCEAGLAAKPVIASNHGGPIETVAHQQTGFLVDPLNPDGIVQAMLHLANDRNLAIIMGKEAQKKISGEFSFHKYLNAFENSCLNLLNPKGRLQ